MPSHCILDTSEIITDVISSRSITPPSTVEEAPTTEFIEVADLRDQSFINIDSMPPPPTRRSSMPELQDTSEEVP